MSKTWIQKGTDAAKDITVEWGMHLEDIPFKIFPDSKDVFKREWPDQNGDDEYLPSTAVFKAYDMDISFAYLGGKDTAGAKIVQMCKYIAGTEFSIYEEHTGIGVRCRYVSWNEKAFYRTDGDIVEFSIKVKVNNPLSYAVKTNESSEIRLAVSSKTAAYWSDGTATLHDNGATISKVMLGGGFGIIAPYSSGISSFTQSVEPTPNKNGYTFTPSLSGDWVLSFSNDGGLANPSPIALNPHSHSNKSILDSITQLFVNAWNAASSWITNTGVPHIADNSIHMSVSDRSKWDAVVGKENSGVAAQLISDLKSGVTSEGDTLKKLYDLIVSSYSEITVQNISARDLYDVKKLPINIFVLDDGDSKWALYKATSIGVGASYVKISDPDLLNSVMSASQIKSSYESNANTNAYTDAEKLKLESGVEPKKGVDEFYVSGDEKNKGALATGVAVLPTVKDVASKALFAPNENGTILYHAAKWFTPTGTISTNGTTAISTSTQFTSAMVGAKLAIMGEERIIATYVNSTTVIVVSAYAQNYTGIISANWGVFNKAVEVTGGRTNMYSSSGKTTMLVGINFDVSGMLFNTSGRWTIDDDGVSMHSANKIVWSASAGAGGVKDIGLKRSSAGVLEVFDGITPGVYRDLNVRNINYYGALTNASDGHLKENTREVTNGLQKALKLAKCVRHFTFKNQDAYAKGQRTGFMAQLLKQHGFEGHVSERVPRNEAEGIDFGWVYKDEYFEDTNPETGEVETRIRRIVDKEGAPVLQIDTNFTPYLFKAIEEMNDKVEKLEARLLKLEGLIK